MLSCVQNMVRIMIWKKNIYASMVLCVRVSEWKTNSNDIFVWIVHVYDAYNIEEAIWIVCWSIFTLLDARFCFFSCFHTHCHHDVCVCLLFFVYIYTFFCYALILFYLLHICDFVWYTSPVTPKDVAFRTHLYTK